MNTQDFTTRELETIYNCLQYAYDGFNSDMSLMDDEEAIDQLHRIASLSEEVKTAMEETDKRKDYGDAFDAMAGHPMEKLAKMSIRSKAA